MKDRTVFLQQLLYDDNWFENRVTMIDEKKLCATNEMYYNEEHTCRIVFFNDIAFRFRNVRVNIIFFQRSLFDSSFHASVSISVIYPRSQSWKVSTNNRIRNF